jgi:hypothetical protein
MERESLINQKVKRRYLGFCNLSEKTCHSCTIDDPFNRISNSVSEILMTSDFYFTGFMIASWALFIPLKNRMKRNIIF